MAEKDETRFERLERSHQETREQMSEMMEMIRALVKEKGKAAAPNPQNETIQPDLRREEPVYPAGYTPPYALNIPMAQAPPMQQVGGFPYGYVPPPTRVNEMGQNSGANVADPIAVPDYFHPLSLEVLDFFFTN